MSDDAHIRQIAEETQRGPISNLQGQINNLTGAKSPLATVANLSALTNRVSSLEAKPGFGVGDLGQWNKASISHQIEYFSMQAVKVDLDGLAMTSDGFTLFGAPIGRFNPLTPLVETVSTKVWGGLLNKFQSGITNSVIKFFAPSSVNEKVERKAADAKHDAEIAGLRTSISEAKMDGLRALNRKVNPVKLRVREIERSLRAVRTTVEEARNDRTGLRRNHAGANAKDPRIGPVAKDVVKLQNAVDKLVQSLAAI